MFIDWDQAVIAPVIDVLGEAVTYRPSRGALLNITGIFNEAYREIDPIEHTVSMSGAQPRLNVRLAEFVDTEPQQGDTLTVQHTGETYRVREVRADGHGGACLLLNAKD